MFAGFGHAIPYAPDLLRQFIITSEQLVACCLQTHIHVSHDKGGKTLNLLLVHFRQDQQAGQARIAGHKSERGRDLSVANIIQALEARPDRFAQIARVSAWSVEIVQVVDALQQRLTDKRWLRVNVGADIRFARRPGYSRDVPHLRQPLYDQRRQYHFSAENPRPLNDFTIDGLRAFRPRLP